MIYLYNIIILPIEFIIEYIFCFVLNHFPTLGVAGAIIAVSISVNFLALPLYNMADSLQLKERELQKKMSKWVSHIKATFKGDEQFMMLSTYYRQNGYHPLYALRSALSILIEIPFFIAAYHFLSHCSALEGQSIIFLNDLSTPDSLFSLFGFSINVLPILMTLINVISTAVYTKGAPLREKLQTYILALVFLGLLYNSPSGLVFYWILNNLFSLIKNVVFKMKNKRLIVWGSIGLILLLIDIYILLLLPNLGLVKKIIVISFTIFYFAIPFIIRRYKKYFNVIFAPLEITRSSFLLFLFSCVSLWLLCGFVLPSAVISSSTKEFSFLCSTDSPLSYILSSVTFFFGLFILWPLCIYKLFGTKVKKILPPVFFIIAVMAVCNVFIFKYNYGTVSVVFALDNPQVLKNYSCFYSILPIFLFFIVFIICFIFYKKKIIKYLSTFIFAVCISFLVVGGVKTKVIRNEYTQLVTIKESQNDIARQVEKIPTIGKLSKIKDNVLILFMDRAISSFFPYILEQFPDMINSFDGFEYYPNCISFAGSTNYSTPSMLGGYEYTVDEINKRNDELLKDKQNEADLVMPRLFYEGGFETYAYNLPYIDYESGSIPDKFNFLNELDTQNDHFLNNYKYTYCNDIGVIQTDRVCDKTIKHFVIMQIMVPVLRGLFSNYSKYYIDGTNLNSDIELFIRPYSELFYLTKSIEIGSENNCFCFIGNDTTHKYIPLKEDYTPGKIEEGKFPSSGKYKWNNGPEYGNQSDMLAYHCNVSAYLQIQKFLDYLKKEDVYDNTRIIIVADHGYDIPLEKFSNHQYPLDSARLNPLLLFKDFDSHGKYVTNNQLMTTAETINLARKGLNLSNMNPYTHKTFKTVNDFESFNVLLTDHWQINTMISKTQFDLVGNKNYLVKDDIFIPSNWVRINSQE